MSTENKLPETQIAAIRYFADLDNCHSFMVSKLWPGGVICPKCGSERVGRFSTGKRRVANCKSCKKQFTVKVGTIFEDSPLGLDKWLPAVWLVVNAKNGVSSCELARSIGVTQKTAWHMAHRIRMALECGTFKKLDGIVEVDESYIGGRARFMHKGKRKAKGTGMGGKTAVMGLLERHSGDKKARLIAGVVPSTHKRELLGRVHKYVLEGAEIHTDALNSYNDLGKSYTHKVVDHAECYVRDGVHTNGLENFWCLLKRSIKGTYVHCAPFHLHRYLGEQVYRFNERKDNDQGRFLNAIDGVVGKRLTYAKLIGTEATA